MLQKKSQCELTDLKETSFPDLSLKKTNSSNSAFALSQHLGEVHKLITQYPPTKNNQGSLIIREKKKERKTTDYFWNILLLPQNKICLKRSWRKFWKAKNAT